jgi:hypothetical protein
VQPADPERAPATGCVDEALVLHAAPIGDGDRFFPAQRAGRQEATCHGAKGKQRHTVLGCHAAQVTGSTPVEQREAHLIGRDGNALLDQKMQMGGVEIGEANLADQTFFAQPHQMFERMKVFVKFVAPPVELHHIDRRQVEPLERGFHPLAHGASIHRAGRRAPFGEDGGRLLARLAQRLVRHAGDDFSASIVVGHVEGVEAVAGIVDKACAAASRS